MVNEPADEGGELLQYEHAVSVNGETRLMDGQVSEVIYC
jgi:hypothetical protein